MLSIPFDPFPCWDLGENLFTHRSNLYLRRFLVARRYSL
jgi:hypothetical protein